jgi:CheY-like chemotaxis protein
MSRQSGATVSYLDSSVLAVASEDPELNAEEEQTPTILLVEDSPAEAKLAIFALQETGVEHHLEWASSITEARKLLRGKQIRPSLILLDYYLPDEKSTQFLYELKADLDLRRIPVVMLTSSELTGDVFRAYDYYANGYVIKPDDLDGYLKVMDSVTDFWLTTARLTAI